MLAKKLALDEAAQTLDVTQEQMIFGGYDALPLDNLDDNLKCEDALLKKWPEVDVIVGNGREPSSRSIGDRVHSLRSSRGGGRGR